MEPLILHNYFRSSTSIRVRVALNLKGLDYHYVSYALLKQEQRDAAYLALNPQGLVPSLQVSPEKVLAQSLAIIEYLDEQHPEPPLLPADPWDRAQSRAMAYSIACDVHPLNNLRVLQTLKNDYGADDERVASWFARWVHASFDALEQQVPDEALEQGYCVGKHVTLADICLYAQMLNNQRFAVDVSAYPKLVAIHDRVSQLEAFERAHPKNQPDAS